MLINVLPVLHYTNASNANRTEQYISNGTTSYKQLVLCMSQSYNVVEMIKCGFFKVTKWF